jgi:hypothetical protein
MKEKCFIFCRFLFLTVWCVLQAVLLGVYDEPMQPAEAATVTEALGDYLKTCGY